MMWSLMPCLEPVCPGKYPEHLQTILTCSINCLDGKLPWILLPESVPIDGAVLGTAFRQMTTITFSFGKKGQYLWPGNEYCGKVHVVSMGITQESWLDDKPHTAVLESEDLKKLPSRMAHTNKGSYGKLLIIAGSVNMSGAACFCAKAAYRMGSGLVRVFTCEQNRLILQTKVPEAVLVTGQENEEETLLAEQLQWRMP